MPRHRTPHASVRTTLTGLALAATAAALTVGGLTPAPAGAEGTTPSVPAGSAPVAKQLFSNPVTPGTYTGLGFDQCHAPEQYKMDAWLAASPYRAVGIYISGASRGCRDQPNLTPTWISTQLNNGWRLLPITLGPQAACNPGFPRYGNDPVISTKVNAAGAYNKAFKQGLAEASTAVAAAQALGIVPGSTLWYDLEGYDVTNSRVPRVLAAVPQRVDRAAARPRLRLRRLLQRRLGHQVARRRPGAAARERSPCPTRSGSRGGTDRPTPRRPTSARTAGGRAAG